MTLRFATFHIRLPESSRSVIGSSASLREKKFVLRHLFSVDRDRAQHEMISMCLRSARIWHPQSGIDVLTDEHTVLEGLPDGTGVRRYALDPTRVMFSRLQAQIQYLRDLSGSETVLLVDSDMLVNGSLNEFEHADFALGLTIRDNQEMPINGGLLIVSGVQRQKAIALLERVSAFYAERYSDQATWWGDQLALRDLVADALGPGGQWVPGDVEAIRLLPSATYNYTPEYGDMYIALSRPRAVEKILHFKGGRKRLMRQYWRAFMDPSASSKWGRAHARVTLHLHAIRQRLRGASSSTVPAFE